ncbi:phosphoribosyltransferase [Massilia sp. CF038]|uniref:phosphoribosyltransferase n=1 Tax=Massilia sp. CF038 TaxID=1881045 RepID=UPI00091DB37D|nr:phosphoribosyltransferase family protein [Massilia sp. CF038]SHG67060.1 Predicted phosphoribosyltransferase [Massilia sp. CF038]
MNVNKRYKDRLHAGQQLALAFGQAQPARAAALILALPRGGVPVGYALAKGLGLPLDVLLVRKLGLPGHEEFAMGAVGTDSVRIVNSEVVHAFHVAPDQVASACVREWRRIAAREQLYRQGRPQPQLQGRPVILVDDGMATGASMRAAIAVARAKGAAHLTVAVPVAAPDTCAAIRREVDQLVCPIVPPAFGAVGAWYRHFDQTEDTEVRHLLAQAWQEQTQHA